MTLIHALLACLGCFAVGGVTGAVYWNRVKTKAAAEVVRLGSAIGSAPTSRLGSAIGSAPTSADTVKMIPPGQEKK